MITQTVFDTAEVLSKKGVKNVVLSPGSRNAPLTISLTRHKDLKVYSVIDERSAGFIALGIALKTGTPTVLCCTSGTALLNYAPAVAEASYQQVPLLILSADRPPEWIDQQDGQSIRQVNILQNLVKASFQLPVDTESNASAWEYNRKLNDAINLSTSSPCGPVHINVPFREPFYPKEDQKQEYSKDVRIIHSLASKHISPDFTALIREWKKYTRRLIVVGQQEPDGDLSTIIEQLIEEKQAVAVTDVIANQTGDKFIRHHDLFLQNPTTEINESIRPDLLITCGLSVVSKSLKLFLRHHRPAHWHFGPGDSCADTFQSLTQLINGDLKEFLHAVSSQGEDQNDFHQQVRANFRQSWKILDEKTSKTLSGHLDTVPFSEFKAFRQVLEFLPGGIDLHLANSMPVRYVNFIQGLKPDTHVFANRGTSGIDGLNGTAVGNAIVGDRTVVVLSGDLSFLYDRNAFLHHHDISRLKIIISNNQGGGIFRLITGPSVLPELETYFETRHRHSAKFTAVEYGFDYFKADSEESLEKGLKGIFKDNKHPKILEIFTTPETNQEVYQSTKIKVHEQK